MDILPSFDFSTERFTSMHAYSFFWQNVCFVYDKRRAKTLYVSFCCRRRCRCMDGEQD
uniref:Uncharacterized protein n=1 Tax=Brassica oleracea TaxID=3712 RepID=A0A3P6EM29_BRAOL|nr:unnamed protein product [Brassica oleracea]